jgi:uncharacterized protein YjbJ (UPF0337 family)
MNKLQFKGSWNEIKGKLKQKYAQLTDDDLAYTEGKDEELVGKLQKKLGKSAEEVRQMLPTLTERRNRLSQRRCVFHEACGCTSIRSRVVETTC